MTKNLFTYIFTLLFFTNIGIAQTIPQVAPEALADTTMPVIKEEEEIIDEMRMLVFRVKLASIK